MKKNRVPGTECPKRLFFMGCLYFIIFSLHTFLLLWSNLINSAIFFSSVSHYLGIDGFTMNETKRVVGNMMKIKREFGNLRQNNEKLKVGEDGRWGNMKSYWVFSFSCPILAALFLPMEVLWIIQNSFCRTWICVWCKPEIIIYSESPDGSILSGNLTQVFWFEISFRARYWFEHGFPDQTFPIKIWTRSRIPAPILVSYWWEIFFDFTPIIISFSTE